MNTRLSLIVQSFGKNLRKFSSCESFSKNASPPTLSEMPRPAGINSMMRLPYVKDTTDLDICFVGIPLDCGTTNRPGTRFGPRQIRSESSVIRKYNFSTGAAPYKTLRVADVGDILLNQYDIAAAVRDIERSYSRLIETGCKAIAVGGDHTLTYPILRSIKEKYGPVGLIHIDAHDDTDNAELYHGSPFRLAGEKGCLDFNRVVQIGLRGGTNDQHEYEFGDKHGFRRIMADECYWKSLTPVMKEVRAMMSDGPVYISFDIDSLDPAYAPGTGTPEIGGLTTIQVLEIIRACRGLNVVGCDLVEVSPPYDPSGNTALTAANFLFELLCIFPGVHYDK